MEERVVDAIERATIELQGRGVRISTCYNDSVFLARAAIAAWNHRTTPAADEPARNPIMTTQKDLDARAHKPFALTLGARSMARHLRDHQDDPHLAAIIEHLCDALDNTRTTPAADDVERVAKAKAHEPERAALEERLDANFRDGTLSTAVRIIANEQANPVTFSCLHEVAFRLDSARAALAATQSGRVAELENALKNARQAVQAFLDMVNVIQRVQALPIPAILETAQHNCPIILEQINQALAPGEVR